MTKPPLLIGGLAKSGKTSFCTALINIARKYNQKVAGFKPFDTGLLARNAKELPGDGELFCKNMDGEPLETLVSPYIAHEQYPIEMAFRRDGIKIDWEFIHKRMKTLDEHYDHTLVELPAGVYAPLTEKQMVIDWIQEMSQQIIWLIRPSMDQFEHNLAEIHALQQNGFRVHMVLNNLMKVSDQDLLFYIWEKLEKFSKQQLEGMIPHTEQQDGAMTPMMLAVEENLPGLIDKIFQ